MQQYTVRALAKLMTSPPRTNITQKELLKLKRELNRSAVRGPAETLTAHNHSKLIDYLRQKNLQGPKIPVSRLRAQINRYLHSRGYVYSPCKHKPAGNPRLYSSGSAICYDLAFYTSLNNHNNPQGHHKCVWGNSVFYARAECFQKTVVWGNLQVDTKVTAAQAGPELGILLRRQNLYQTMVQEVIKHSLSAGCERVVFQAGSAAAWAQWGKVLPKKFNWAKTLITPQNYSDCQKEHAARCADFAQLGLGIYSSPPSGLFPVGSEPSLEKPVNFCGSYLLICQKTPESISGYWVPNRRGTDGLLYMLVEYYAAQERKTGAGGFCS